MTDEQSNTTPTADDFVNYLPWACNQMQVDAAVVVTTAVQAEYTTALTDRSKKTNKSRTKLTQSKHEIGSDQEKESVSYEPQLVMDQKIVKIVAVYDSYNNLVEIKFDKNRQIPRLLLKVIGLIVHFYFHLNKIIINGGLDTFTIYEINKIIKISNITEICLDYSFVKEGNYYILFETENSIRHLSLSKCKINDKAIEEISKKLVYPLPASKTLTILNLSTNRITDVGVKYLAEALRSNRKLSYLNLADNNISDDGAFAILDTLTEFSLQIDEIRAAKARHITYLNDKTILIERTMKEILTGDFDKKSISRKSVRPASSLSGKKSKLEKESSLKSVVDTASKSVVSMDSLCYEKAVAMAKNVLGEFDDPFSVANTQIKDGVTYCMGNNALVYLNVAYNNLTYLSLKKILNVLMFQKLLERKPRGILNLYMEGNLLPISCNEFKQVDDIIDMEFIALSRRMSASKKRGHAKITSR